MRRRRWARAAAVLCLAIVVALHLVAACEGRRPLLPPPGRARGHAHAHNGKGLPPSTGSASSSSLPVRHDEAAAGASVSFNAAGTRCKTSERKAGGFAGQPAAAAAAACAGEEDDDKRRIPTGPNPLHNR